MLRILLPPNLAAAAPRNAIALRIELDLAAPPRAGLVPALAVLQRLGVRPEPVALLSCTRAQVRELLGVLAGERVVYRLDRPRDPLPWNGLDLPGVTEHLAEPSAPPAPARPPANVRNTNNRPRAAPPAPDLAPLTVDGSEHFLAITLPSRESPLHESALEFVRAHRFALDPLTRKWWLRDRHKVLNLLATHGDELRESFGAVFTENFQKHTARLRPVGFAAEVVETAGADEITLGLRAGDAPEAEVRAAVAGGRGYIEDGRHVYLVAPARLEKLRAAHRALAGDASVAAVNARHRVARARATEVAGLLEGLDPHFQAPAAWRARGAAMRDLSTLAPAPVPGDFAAALRPYQRLGVAWLWHLLRQGLGGILADEMGLGKTPQALALLAAATASGQARPPHLVAVPASLLENWRREAARFAPGLRVFVHHGARRLDAAGFTAHDLVLTSYGTLARDTGLFAGVEFGLILADEAQHLKNRRTQAAQSLRALRGRGRFLLTGTPLENSLDDLRALFDFLMPGFLAPVPAGLKREDRVWHDEQLRARTAPYILRRTKQSVAPELPEKIEQVLPCEPTAAQAALYRRLQEDGERELIDLAARGSSEGSLRFAALTQLLRLRQACCDPRLVPGHASAGPEDSAKLEVFRELLAESIDEGHRMLVFSQFTSLLALLREELETEGVAFCYLDGSLTPKARQAEVDRFQAADGPPVFLISLKAGGTGLNLTAADVVVHFDPWWNPAAEAQATDRAHRLGQTKVVTSYKLICSGTVEEKVLALQDAKRALLADVFEASDAAAARLSLADLRGLLA
jgi:superfamily II DNA or RNA helicase